MRDRLSRTEIRKDAVQDTVEAAASAAGQLGTILTGAVRDVARTVGGFATDVFEIRDAARRATHEAGDDPEPGPHAVQDVDGDQQPGDE